MTGPGSLPPLEGALAPPRSNGEPVFGAPWESRAFGMVVCLERQGRFAWNEFRERLIEAIAENGERPYYESWVAAFQRLALERGLLTAAELDERRDDFVSGRRSDVF
jgi:nitrile hydratase accessory protein